MRFLTTKTSACTLAIAIVGCFWSYGAQPQSHKPATVVGITDAGVLKGLKAVRVLVEPITPEIQSLGLSRDDIQTDVELRLRQAGVTVTEEKEWETDPARPFLHVVVGAGINDGLVCYSVSLYLQEVLLSVRSPGTRHFGAITWTSRGRYGVVGGAKVGQLRDVVKDQADQFCNAFLKVNPK